MPNNNPLISFTGLNGIEYEIALLDLVALSKQYKREISEIIDNFTYEDEIQCRISEYDLRTIPRIHINSDNI